MTAPSDRAEEGAKAESFRGLPALPGAKPSVCIVCHKAYGALRGGRSGDIGGVEWQASVLARWLGSRGWAVAVLTWADGGEAVEEFGGVRVIKITGRSDGWKGLRFFHPRWTGLIKAMRRADCDVYYHHGAECVTGQIAHWCRQNGKSFVFSAACDTDYDARMKHVGGPVDRFLYRYGLKAATRIISQTEAQKADLQKNFGLSSIVLRYPCYDPGGGGRILAPGDRLKIVWVGRVCAQKRPDVLLDLAEKSPEVKFDVVGPVYSDPYAQGVFRRAEGMSNVTFHGPVSRGDIGAFYKRSDVLCCTSDFEGFPNTFLEAWSHGLPVVSTLDPDGIISRWNLGIVAKNVEGLAKGLRFLQESQQDYAEISKNAWRYFNENHRMEVVLPQYERMFQMAMPPMKAI